MKLTITELADYFYDNGWILMEQTDTLLHLFRCNEDESEDRVMIERKLEVIAKLPKFKRTMMIIITVPSPIIRDQKTVTRIEWRKDLTDADIGTVVNYMVDGPCMSQIDRDALKQRVMDLNI